MTASAKAVCATLALASLLLAGCTAGRQDGALYSEGNTSLPGTYYAEFFDAERKRWYLLQSPGSAAAFQAGARELPMSKTLIGAGPDRATVMVELGKDADYSLLVGRRLVATFNARHGTAAKL